MTNINEQVLYKNSRVHVLTHGGAYQKLRSKRRSFIVRLLQKYTKDIASNWQGNLIIFVPVKAHLLHMKMNEKYNLPNTVTAELMITFSAN